MGRVDHWQWWLHLHIIDSDSLGTLALSRRQVPTQCHLISARDIIALRIPGV
jgi:hypothetical protein